MNLNKHFLIQKFNLKPLEPEGGFFERTYISENNFGSAIFYLIDNKNFSQLHRLKCDEIFHFYADSEVELITFGKSKELKKHYLGPLSSPHQECQLLVPANTWQGLRLTKPDSWALLGTTCFPAFSFDLFEPGKRDQLIQNYPQLKSVIEQFTL